MIFNLFLDDCTRVVLLNQPDGDYINANYVNMEIPGGSTNRYIGKHALKFFVVIFMLTFYPHSNTRTFIKHSKRFLEDGSARKQSLDCDANDSYGTRANKMSSILADKQ